MSLHDVIRQIRSGEGNRNHWLLIHGEAEELGLSTDSVLSRVDVDEDSEDLEEIIPQEFADRGLWSTIEFETVRNCIAWGDRLADGPSDEAAADVIRYYIRFDAFPESLGASDPPSPDVIQEKLDREFFESLGEERSGTHCRASNCSRGAVGFSAFCARHHFESVKRRPCPF